MRWLLCMRLPALVAILMAAALAGCLGDDDTGIDGPGVGPDNDDENTNSTAEPDLFLGTGSIAASAPVFALGSGGVDFNVKEGATLLLAEIRWDDPAFDINLALSSPDAGETGTARNYDHVANGGSPGSPDSPHSLTVEAPKAGAWGASAFANGAAANVEYEIVVTVFFEGDAVPEGYSGFE